LAPQVADPYEMAVAAIDEAVRNVIAVGASPSRVAILDNFCWPSVDNERSMGELVRTCEACRDAALAYGIPFISGKDSLHNQFTNSETGEVIRIPNTLLISAIAVIDDVTKCVTMDLKDGTDRFLLIRPRGNDLATLAKTHRTVAAAIATGRVRACHDVSEGGVLVAVAEMCIASGLGATLPLGELPAGVDAFDELLGSYLLSVQRDNIDAVSDLLRKDVELKIIGDASPAPHFVAFRSKEDSMDLSVNELTAAWRGTLDW
jgi:phosphoribosylformylglycinamidine synthase